jgi:hypothetical protein
MCYVLQRQAEGVRCRAMTAIANVVKTTGGWPIAADKTQRAVDSVPMGLRVVAFKKPAEFDLDGTGSATETIELFAHWARCECGATWREWWQTTEPRPRDECGPCPECRRVVGTTSRA